MMFLAIGARDAVQIFSQNDRQRFATEFLGLVKE